LQSQKYCSGVWAITIALARRIYHVYCQVKHSSVIGCLHDRANIEQLARRSLVISMLIKRAGGLYNTWSAVG